jgi:hypothetical protein
MALGHEISVKRADGRQRTGNARRPKTLGAEFREVVVDIRRRDVAHAPGTEAQCPSLKIASIGGNGVAAPTLFERHKAKELLDEARYLHGNYSASL